MPLPQRLGHFNRAIPNPVIRPAAARVPPLAVVEHVGRRSGRTHRTPVLAFPTGDGWTIALVYGESTDWVRNVLAARGCTLVRAGRRIRLNRPRLVTGGEGHVPGWMRMGMRALGVGRYVALDADPGAW